MTCPARSFTFSLPRTLSSRHRPVGRPSPFLYLDLSSLRSAFTARRKIQATRCRSLPRYVDIVELLSMPISTGAPQSRRWHGCFRPVNRLSELAVVSNRSSRQLLYPRRRRPAIVTDQSLTYLCLPRTFTTCSVRRLSPASG